MRSGEKGIDAVRLMRQIRDRLSARFRTMSPAEQQLFIQEQLKRAGIDKVARQRHRRSA